MQNGVQIMHPYKFCPSNLYFSSQYLARLCTVTSFSKDAHGQTNSFAGAGWWVDQMSNLVFLRAPVCLKRAYLKKDDRKAEKERRVEERNEREEKEKVTNTRAGLTNRGV